jgi:hypothetical protein
LEESGISLANRATVAHRGEIGNAIKTTNDPVAIAISAIMNVGLIPVRQADIKACCPPGTRAVHITAVFSDV